MTSGNSATRRLPGTAHSGHHNSGRDPSEWNSFPCSSRTSLSKRDETLIINTDSKSSCLVASRHVVGAKQEQGLCELLYFAQCRRIGLHPSMVCSVDAKFGSE